MEGSSVRLTNDILSPLRRQALQQFYHADKPVGEVVGLGLAHDLAVLKRIDEDADDMRDDQRDEKHADGLPRQALGQRNFHSLLTNGVKR